MIKTNVISLLLRKQKSKTSRKSCYYKILQQNNDVNECWGSTTSCWKSIARKEMSYPMVFSIQNKDFRYSVASGLT